MNNTVITTVITNSSDAVLVIKAVTVRELSSCILAILGQHAKRNSLGWVSVNTRMFDASGNITTSGWRNLTDCEMIDVANAFIKNGVVCVPNGNAYYLSRAS